MAKYPFLKPVESSMFSRFGYDEETWMLVFEFRSTKEIRGYKHVSPEVADEAASAKSLGTWWNANIKGNASWEFEVLGAEEPDEPAPKPAEKQDERGLADAELDMIWKEPKPGEYPPSDAGNITLEKLQAAYGEAKFNDPNNLPAQFGFVDFKDLPADTRTVEEVQQDIAEMGEAVSAAITTQPVGEVLSAWTAPESAAEALDLLAEREGEIKAIVAQCVQTGQQALTVRVDSAESSAAASETLNRIVAKKTTTIAALDPFRSVLYEIYQEAAKYKKDAVDPLEAGERHIKGQILSWNQAQERIRQDALRKAREEAEAEARRLQEAEAARIKLADVQDAIDSGDQERAQTLFDAPVVEVPRPYVAPTYIPPAAPKVEGQSTSTTWKVDRDAVESDETGVTYIASITTLLRAVKDGSYPIDQAAPLLSWDFAMADKRASSMMSAFNVPGLSAAPKSSLRVGAGRKKKG
jgi:hypothetical protein